MAKKQHQKPKQKKKGILGRSDIPYAQRIQMQLNAKIAANRDHAAKIAMFCISIAMHDLEGIGYRRLVRFSCTFRDIINEFYEDPELGMAHAKQRLEQIGMPISGEMYEDQLDGVSRSEQLIYQNSLQSSQVALIMGAIAMHEEFHFAKERQNRISKRVSELSARYAKEGEGFLLEEMAKIGFLIKGNEVVAYLDSEENPIMPKTVRRERKEKKE